MLLMRTYSVPDAVHPPVVHPPVVQRRFVRSQRNKPRLSPVGRYPRPQPALRTALLTPAPSPPRLTHLTPRQCPV